MEEQQDNCEPENGNPTSQFSPLNSQLSPLNSQFSPLNSHLSPLNSHLSPLTSQFSPLTYQFPKSERIVSKKLMEELFSGKDSQSKAAFPLRVVYMSHTRKNSSEPPVTVLMSVSKRHFKHAVDRNRVKRQLREAYRLNKHLLSGCVSEGQQLCLAFIWLSDQLAPTSVVFSKMKQLLKSIAHHCTNGPKK